MKFNEILNIKLFEKLSILDKEIILAYLINKDRSYLLARSEEEAGVEVEERFLSLCERRLEGEPVAYLINSKEFYAMDFYVDERALIPRPETEFLVDEVLKLARNFSVDKILDLGMGSGCIAISLAKNMWNCDIIASDISKEALEVAKINANKFIVQDRVRFVESDLLKSFKGEKFDVIVTNPPYIGVEKYNFVEENVKKFEPVNALFSGKDGLDFYRNFFIQLVEYKISSRFIVGEFGDGQADEVRRIVSNCFPEADLRIGRDYARKERWFVCAVY